MRATFVVSPTLGPLFKMVLNMLSGDVKQWLVLYLCFFAAFQAPTPALGTAALLPASTPPRTVTLPAHRAAPPRRRR